jgi:flagellar biosynthesis protein FliP
MNRSSHGRPKIVSRRWWMSVIGLSVAWACLSGFVSAQEPLTASDLEANGPLVIPTIPVPAGSNPIIDTLSGGPKVWTSPEGLVPTLQVMLLLTVLSLAPAILLMTTSFVRIIVVLGLLRQALGTQQLPPSQVITSIAMFMTLLIMTPVWKDVYDNSIKPYSQPDTEMSLEEAWDAGVKPIRRFMSRQIEMANNSDDIWLFYQYMPKDTATPQTYDEVPLQVLLPAYMLSELKTAFLIGFQIYLPFLILDVVISSVTISMGMMMLPPVMISLPFKLMLFVLVDGWNLVVGMLLESFAPYS